MAQCPRSFALSSAKYDKFSSDSQYTADVYLASPRDVAGSDAELRQLDDPHPDVVGQRPPVDEHPAQLVHLAVLTQMRL